MSSTSIYIPTDNELRYSIAEVFSKVIAEYEDKLLNALVVVDRSMHKGYSMINYVVDYEMEEICDFVNSFNAHIKQSDDEHQKARIKCLIYCHIMEADLPLTIFWNLHRIVKGEPCDWTFHRVTKGGKVEVCQLTRQKIAELKRLSLELGVQVGCVMDRLWNSALRNMISHSQYCWMGDRLTSTALLSPLSRKGGNEKSSSFSLEDINKYYEAATSLLYYFVETYEIAISRFRDGNPHQVDAGWIVWDHQAGWIWKGNVEKAT